MMPGFRVQSTRTVRTAPDCLRTGPELRSSRGPEEERRVTPPYLSGPRLPRRREGEIPPLHHSPSRPRKGTLLTEWTHPVCLPCFGELMPDRLPVRLAQGARKLEHCCRCSLATGDGIYVRADPHTLTCHGDHDHQAARPHWIWGRCWCDHFHRGTPPGLAFEPPPVMSRLGDPVRQFNFTIKLPFADLTYLPTMPGTQLEHYGAWVTAECRTGRILARLHLWKLRSRHHTRHHRQNPATAALPAKEGKLCSRQPKN